MIKHERWLTGKIMAKPEEAVIYYKDFGTKVQITGWKNVPSLKELACTVTTDDWQFFKEMKGCAEVEDTLVIPGWWEYTFHGDRTDKIINKNGIIGRDVFQKVVEGVLRAVELKKKYTSDTPELKYVIIGGKE